MSSVDTNTVVGVDSSSSSLESRYFAAQRIHGVVQQYSWGSRTAIAELTRRASPTDRPEAELWLGAHPNGPSTLESGALLSDAINRSPVSALGTSCVDQFGPRLPFLFKILAAEAALSLQAHPTLDKARAGFARENAAGLPINSPTRNYRDDNHKPELLVALTEFHALAGFRHVNKTVDFICALNVPELLVSVRSLDEDGLRDLFEQWLSLDEDQTQELCALALGGCRRYLAAAPRGDFADDAQMVIDLIEQYPGDSGVLAALLLNRVTLEPGEGIYLDPGHLHAYLRGTGIEVMANSDNVLRGGLTSKHLDRNELMRVLRFQSIAPPIIRAEPLVSLPRKAAVLQYPTPAPEFQLRRVDINPGKRTGISDACTSASGPQILLCTKGTCRITVQGVATINSGSGFVVVQGESIWIPAGGTASISSEGVASQVFIATSA